MSLWPDIPAATQLRGELLGGIAGLVAEGSGEQGVHGRAAVALGVAQAAGISQTPSEMPAGAMASDHAMPQQQPSLPASWGQALQAMLVDAAMPSTPSSVASWADVLGHLLPGTLGSQPTSPTGGPPWPGASFSAPAGTPTDADGSNSAAQMLGVQQQEQLPATVLLPPDGLQQEPPPMLMSQPVLKKTVRSELPGHAPCWVHRQAEAPAQAADGPLAFHGPACTCPAERRARILKDGQLTMIVYGESEALLWAQRVATLQTALRCADCPPCVAPRLCRHAWTFYRSMTSDANDAAGHLRIRSAMRRGVLGDRRRNSLWTSSVMDSVIGAFLTQNVADSLSSKAFMQLASIWPAQTVGGAHGGGVRSVVDWEAVRCADPAEVRHPDRD